MFAVPGWNLSAKSLVREQVKPVKDKPPKGSVSSAEASQSETKITSRKRKRKHDSDQDHGPPSKSHSGNKAHTTETIAGAPVTKDQDTDEASKKKSKTRPARGKSKTGENAHGQAAAADIKDVKSPNISSLEDDAAPERKTSSKSTDQSVTPQHTTNGRANRQVLPPIPPPPNNLTPLQAKMRAKLTSARFRHLNETLYTTSSADAKALFANSPDLFIEYHNGFSQQVKDSWPQNPVEKYIKVVKSRGKLNTPAGDIQPLPRRKPGQCKIVDLGCGDAPLAQGLQNVVKKLGLTIYSYDLHAPNSHVTIADIAALPLHDGEVDVAIFCLSLMGTNWLTFVEEAWRVLRGDGKGEIWVSEVKSRFGRISARKTARKVVENSVGKRRKGPAVEHDAVEDRGLAEVEQPADMPGSEDDTDLQPFIDSFQRRGFYLKQGSIDRTNKMFVSMVFTKSGIPRAGKWKSMKWNGKEYQRMEDQRPGQHRNYQRPGAGEEIDEEEEGKLLKPCVYKQR